MSPAGPHKESATVAGWLVQRRSSHSKRRGVRGPREGAWHEGLGLLGRVSREL